MVVLGTRPDSTNILLVNRIEGQIIEFRGFEATIFGDQLRKCTSKSIYLDIFASTFPNNNHCFVHPIFPSFG